MEQLLVAVRRVCALDLPNRQGGFAASDLEADMADGRSADPSQLAELIDSLVGREDTIGGSENG